MSHVAEVSHAIAIAMAMASHVIWISIYSPHSSRSQADCFYTKRHYFTLGSEPCESPKLIFIHHFSDIKECILYRHSEGSSEDRSFRRS